MFLHRLKTIVTHSFYTLPSATVFLLFSDGNVVVAAPASSAVTGEQCRQKTFKLYNSHTLRLSVSPAWPVLARGAGKRANKGFSCSSGVWSRRTPRTEPTEAPQLLPSQLSHLKSLRSVSTLSRVITIAPLSSPSRPAHLCSVSILFNALSYLLSLSARRVRPVARHRNAPHERAFALPPRQNTARTAAAAAVGAHCSRRLRLRLQSRHSARLCSGALLTWRLALLCSRLSASTPVRLSA